MDLFEAGNQEKRFAQMPLAARMRPRTLDEFYGQAHILGREKLLRRMIETDQMQSLIFWGPPGCGKTALAHIIAEQTKARFVKLNAVIAKVDDLRQVIKDAKDNQSLYSQRTIVFVDELHRFNKAQQDALLPDVEDGTIILIGATTQNPFHSVISALVSRSQVFRFESLEPDAIADLLKSALIDDRGLGRLRAGIEADALSALATLADGDARKALNALELAATALAPGQSITQSMAEEAIQSKTVVYDENDHYDTISAFIKSMRGSDPDAAVYWLAKMIYAGEDPAFIARRIVICASEDVGNADPQALVVANAAREVVEFVGLPEARIPLSQAAIYVACAPKSNASYLAIDAALADVKQAPTQKVPDHLKNAVTAGEKQMGIGKGYQYAHNHGGYVAQSHMPEPKIYYRPTENGMEKKIKEKLSQLRLAPDVM